MRTREIFSTMNGQPVPVTVDLNVEPLKYGGKAMKNGHGSVVMNNSWIYVWQRGYGYFSINVNRSQYCEKIYLSNITIRQSINYGKTNQKLDRFIEQVSDKVVFEKNGITYRVYLKKTKSGFDLDYVKPFWLITHSPNIYYTAIPEKYKDLVILPEKSYSKLAHELIVDLKKAFNFDEN